MVAHGFGKGAPVVVCQHVSRVSSLARCLGIGPVPANLPATWTVVVTGWPTTGLGVVEVIEVDDADFCAWGVTLAGALGPESPTVVWAMTVTV